MQESEETKSTQSKMESLRLNCERDIQNQLKEVETVTTSFSKYLDSIKSTVDETVQNQGKLLKLKSRLKEVEGEFVKVLAAKTRKEAKQMAIKDSLSAVTDRVKELEKTLQVQRRWRDSSQESLALQTSEEKGKRDSVDQMGIQQAISWYNRALGFQIKGGHGVNFIFKNISVRDPQVEYSFTIRHEYDSDTYTLLACIPHVDDTKELIHELNSTNSLFGFVRTMRQKFQEAASQGDSCHSEMTEQESCIVSVAAPVLSGSTVRSGASIKENEHTPDEVERGYKKIKHGKLAKKVSHSPASVRKSPRLLANRLK